MSLGRRVVLVLPVSTSERNSSIGCCISWGEECCRGETSENCSNLRESHLCIWYMERTRLSQLGLRHGWNEQFFFLTDSCSPSSLISHHSDRLQQGMLIASRPERGGCADSACAALPPQGLPASNPARAQPCSYPRGELQAISDLPLNFKQRDL